jgi:hypothetical protein
MSSRAKAGMNQAALKEEKRRRHKAEQKATYRAVEQRGGFRVPLRGGHYLLKTEWPIVFEKQVPFGSLRWDGLRFSPLLHNAGIMEVPISTGSGTSTKDSPAQ